MSQHVEKIHHFVSFIHHQNDSYQHFNEVNIQLNTSNNYFQNNCLFSQININENNVNLYSVNVLSPVRFCLNDNVTRYLHLIFVFEVL